MQISFDTASVAPQEITGLIALLDALISHPQQIPPPASEQEAIFGVSTQAIPTDAPTTGPTLVQPEVSAEPNTKRTRRTKAEIAADEAAKQAPMEAVRGSLNVSEAGDVEVAAKVPATPTETSAKPITADELRASLNAYIAKHSMEEAIAILKSFGCGRVSEALALDPAKLAELAGQLNG